MRQPSPEWIAAAVNGFAHGRGDDATWLGYQRERPNDLGFGWLYFALAQFPIFLLPHLLKPLARRLSAKR